MTNRTSPHAIDLTSLSAGDVAVLDGTDLGRDELALLQALGLTDHCKLRVCKAGDPWIVQVFSTRIGLANAVARRLQVVRQPQS